ncbi:MAG: sodium:solute symporter [Bacteroidota bacterium]|nr:sodium:solute symporter [Bacteroidota bacterium]
MSIPDWIVLLSTLVFITVYGIYKSRGNKNIEGYLLGNKTMPWYTIGLSIMATQASAITFLSAPGQAFTDGMRFLQFYFGLPIAMVVLCVTVVPIFHRMKIYTAYEYLETRFDLKTRSLGALLFLIQRGLAAGLTIYAPSIILSSLLGWNIYLTNIFIGGIVVLYTVAGGTKAVSYTQLGQMTIILSGIGLAAFLLFQMLPEQLSFGDVITIAGKAGKLNLVDFSFDLNNRYNAWSGIIGGFFLAMAYFGTDQSQVGRYLTGKSITEIRLGLLFNGVVKIPMQLFILFIGALLYVFYIFQPQPIFFNQVEIAKVQASSYSADFKALENNYTTVQASREKVALQIVEGVNSGNDALADLKTRELLSIEKESQILKQEAKGLMKKNDKLADVNDTNYVFLKFVTDYLPVGIIGLLIAVIFAASMSSTSSELNALASTSIVDIYKRSIKKDGDEKHYLVASKWATVLWGAYAIAVAEFANRLGSLIEAVNILGSLFYGTILGIFLVGFYMKKIGGNAVFISAIVAEAVVIWCYNYTGISFLWYNLIGCFIVMGLAWVLENFTSSKKNGPEFTNGS